MSKKYSNQTPTLSFKKGNRVASGIIGGKRKTIYLNPTGAKGEKTKLEGRDFKQLPKKNQRDCLYVCAPNQAGKTTYLSKFIEEYLELKPDKEIVIFSKLEADPILDKVGDFFREPLREYQLEDDTLERLSDSLTIFDDVDQIHDKRLFKDIMNTINEILCNGSHFGIDIAITNHLLSDYRNTRIILNECSSITVFPKSGCNHQINHVLRNYVGLDNQQIEKIKKLPSRWVTIFKTYPQAVLYQDGIYLLH